MGTDDREEEVCCITVPEELVATLIMTSLDVMEEWHRENSMEVDLMRCSAAMMVAAKVLNARFMGYPEGMETLQ